VPFYRFEIESPLDPDAVLARLRPLAGERPTRREAFKQAWGGVPADATPLIGWIEDNGFQLERRIGYRNSFLPQAHGVVVQATGGSRILVTMQMHFLVVGFMIFWLGAVGVGLVGALSSHPMNKSEAVVLAGMFLFGVLLTAGGFIPEARTLRRVLEEALDARPE
jgi:hypothetical protein